MGLLSSLLGTLSGNSDLKVSEQLLFDKVIGFKSIVPGCGASTLLANVAIALSQNTKYNICVLDTNFMYPIQYGLLGGAEIKPGTPDVLDFSGDLSLISRNTNYTNVYIVQLENRNVVDLLSGKDSEDNINKLIANLKSYFDVILIDISSSELSNTAIHSAIKCNKIFLVSDYSYNALYSMKKAINSIVTLGVPLAKCNNIVINKTIPELKIGVNSLVEEAGLKIVGTIPMSTDVAIACAKGAKIYGASSRDRGMTAFNLVVESILDMLLEKSPLNEKYMELEKELNRREEERLKAQEALKAQESSIYGDDDEDDDEGLLVGIEELQDDKEPDAEKPNEE